MAQTDRQTDTTKKSTWWLTTTFNEVECARLQDPTTYPPDVLKVHGGMEECPETKRLHFQGAVQLRPGIQQRMSYFKTWLPTTNFRPAVSSEAVRKYAMKSETAIGDKVVRENPTKFYNAHELCLLIGSKITDDDILETIDQKVWFKRSINRILREDITLASQLMNPSLRNFWVDTCRVWIDKSREETEAQAEEEP